MRAKGDRSTKDYTADWQDIVARIYAIPIDPSNYDELMAAWDSYIAAKLQANAEAGNGATGLALDIDEQVQTHFRQALLILEKLGRQNGADSGARAPEGPLPAIALSARGRVLAANDAYHARFAPEDPKTLDDLPLDETGLAALREALPALAEEQDREILVQGAPDDTGRSNSFCLYGARDEAGDAYAVLQLIGIGWSPRIGAILSATFGLTEAETDIARAIAQGEQARAIAEARGRSIETVRTQIRSILQKTGAGSQTELVRLVAGLNPLSNGTGLSGRCAGSPDTDAPLKIIQVTRATGQPMTVRLIGPESGRPALFIHGMLDGTDMTPRQMRALHDANIRLIAPVRPHFGDTPPDKDARSSVLQRMASDAASVLDALSIKACPVIGHMAGAPYAFAIAHHNPNRISRVVSLAGGVPILSDAQFSMMGHRQKVVARTARYLPHLLPMILRAGIALLDSGGESRFMHALYKGADTDLTVTGDKDIHDALIAGYRFATAQGYRAFEIDSGVVTSDWSAVTEGIACPVSLVHGTHDPVVAIPTVRDFAARNPDFDLHEFSECGQLIFYAEPENVLAYIFP